MAIGLSSLYRYQELRVRGRGYIEDVEDRRRGGGLCNKIFKRILLQEMTETKSKVVFDREKYLESPYTYATLMEVNDEESEAWYYFIRYEGNEEALAHLRSQIETVDWILEEGLSTFDLELDYLVSEMTAKEMTILILNSYAQHRKFDGVLKKIDLNLKPLRTANTEGMTKLEKKKEKKKVKKKNEKIHYKNMVEVYEKIGLGSIAEFFESECEDVEGIEFEDSENGSDGHSSEEDGHSSGEDSD